VCCWRPCWCPPSGWNQSTRNWSPNDSTSWHDSNLLHHRPYFRQPADQPTGSVCASAGGIPGIESPEEYSDYGHACCLVECGRCGGADCSKLTGSATDCCITDITDTGRECSVTNEAPCFIAAGKSTRSQFWSCSLPQCSIKCVAESQHAGTFESLPIRIGFRSESHRSRMFGAPSHLNLHVRFPERTTWPSPIAAKTDTTPKMLRIVCSSSGMAPLLRFSSATPQYCLSQTRARRTLVPTYPTPSVRLGMTTSRTASAWTGTRTPGTFKLRATTPRKAGSPAAW